LVTALLLGFGLVFSIAKKFGILWGMRLEDFLGPRNYARLGVGILIIATACGAVRTPVVDVFATEEAKADASRTALELTQSALGICADLERINGDLATLAVEGGDQAIVVTQILAQMTERPVPACATATATVEPVQ